MEITKKICPKCNYYMDIDAKVCLGCRNRGELKKIKESMDNASKNN